MYPLLTELVPVSLSGPSPGHGQGVIYNGHAFYYACEIDIPKDRVVSLVREGNRHSSRSWLIVAWDEGHGGFRLLEIVDRDLMHRIRPYKDLTVEQALRGNDEVVVPT